MKTKFGSIIVAGSGKIGGHVASKNRGGSYLRTKVTPINPQTVSQGGVRGLFTSLSQAWRALTQAQRDAWNAAVSDFARTDVFGDLRNPSGINLFQRLNNQLNSIGEATIDTPPVPSAVAEIRLVSATNATAVPDMEITLNANVPANTAVKIFATAPMSAGKSFVKSEYRQIAVLPAAQASPYDLLAEYVAKFGSNGEIGQKIFFKAVPVNATTGQTGGITSVSVTAAA